ncbi:MAG: aminotransferase class I/II-fold pyridoxal phosphate-dependent enzyme [Bacillota bacterium]
MSPPAFETILARAGLGRTATSTAKPGLQAPEPLSEPLALSSVYRFRDLEQVDEVWEGREEGFVYRRLGHPNQTELERVMAGLEEAEKALACSSGMAALLAALVSHLESGDVVLAQAGLYGGTRTLLAEGLTRLGIEAVSVPRPTAGTFAAALDGLASRGRRARAVIVETVANPSLEVADLPSLAALARERGVLLVVDNTFATPLGCRPLRWGPALVVESLTKFLNGHSDVIGGVIAGPAEAVERARKTAATMGLGISPLDAWLTLRGLRTLHLRLGRQSENAARVAAWLEGRPGVAAVLYPGLPSHPSAALARAVLSSFGAMVSFELEGGEREVAAFLGRLRLIPFSPSLGETATTITYPYRTSHRSLSDEERTAARAGPGLLRLSVGTEAAEDILEDLEHALEACST